MPLRESVRQWVLRNLPYDQSDAALLAHLNSLDARGLLIVYHNWMSWLIKPQPRTVLKSKAFQQNLLSTQRASDLTQIIDDIEKGHDLRKYLSRGVKSAAEIPGGPLSRRRDLDLMLNAQGVHHLHISTVVDADGYVRRDGPLLFAVFKQAKAYLIDIMGHGDWTKDHVLNVMASEWPTDGVIHELKGVIGLAHNYTEEERAKLQKHGINMLVQVGGKVFMPGGGVTGAGTTVAASRAADQLIIQIDEFEKTYAQKPTKMRAVFEKGGRSFPNGSPRYEFGIMPDGPGVIEMTSNVFVPFKALEFGS